MRLPSTFLLFILFNDKLLVWCLGSNIKLIHLSLDAIAVIAILHDFKPIVFIDINHLLGWFMFGLWSDTFVMGMSQYL